MTITLAQATDLANHQLVSGGVAGLALQLLPDQTKEFDVGWVFYYQSARYIETGDFSEMVVGNAPIFISRSDGSQFFIHYHRPLEESLAAYRASGNPNAQEIPEVRLTGWRTGALTVSAVLAVHQHAAIGLVQAKSMVESCLGNRSPVVRVPSVTEARALVADLASVGFESAVCYVQPDSADVN